MPTFCRKPERILSLGARGGENRRAAEDRPLLNPIQRIFESTRGRHGSRRITTELRDQGCTCSRPGLTPANTNSIKVVLLKQGSLLSSTPEK
ncbi:MAG: transposase [Candidatus Marinimicrobia bacterium]|nr:transposase [Candidatus Neomarinimicrobiota bacterium]